MQKITFITTFLRPASSRVLLLAAAMFFVHNADAAAPFVVSDAVEFAKIVDTNTATLTTHATISEASILEGPTWIPGDPGYLVFSSMNWNYANTSGNRLKKLVLPNTVSDYLVPPANTVYNGSTLDAQERLISCQSGSAGLSVVMITNTAAVTPLVTTVDGLKFYSPNDVVVKSDGTIWFTDPGFNSNIRYLTAGHVIGHNVYWFNPTNGNATCTSVISFPSDSSRPNGLCFSPEEDLLYLAEYDKRRILVYSVSPSNRCRTSTSLPTCRTSDPRTAFGAMPMAASIPARATASMSTCPIRMDGLLAAS